VCSSGSGRVAFIQSQLDSFLAAAVPVYRTPDGNVQVATPFRLPRSYPDYESSVVRPNNRAVCAAARAIGMSDATLNLVLHGRGTPAQVQQLTQRLIDAGRLPPATPEVTLEIRVRQMMIAHGIGFDCAGYVRQAFIAAHPDAGVAWRAPLNEDLTGLAARGMTRLSIDDAQPGDLLVLKPPPHEFGHTVVVYDVRPLTAEEREHLDRLVSGTPALAPFAASCMRVFIFDSSWGSGGNATVGGAQRQKWVQDQTTGKWLSLDGRGYYALFDQPYDHSVEGVYRPAGGR
jgi:hypothetical protein